MAENFIKTYYIVPPIFFFSVNMNYVLHNDAPNCIQDVLFADLLFTDVEWQRILLNTFLFPKPS